MAAVALAAVGCAQEQYAGPGVYAFALDESVPPIMTSGTFGNVYWIERRIELPIVPPSDAQMTALMELPAGTTLPFPRMPWVKRDDLDVELELIVSSLVSADPSNPDATDRVKITLNGINEFDEYVPGVELTREGFVQHFSQWQNIVDMKRGERRAFVVRREQLDEVAVDLATVVNGAPNPNEIVYFANQSDHDPRAAAYIPAVVPGLVGYRVGLMTEGETAGRWVAEVSVRVRDHGDRLAARDDTPWVLPVPRIFDTLTAGMTTTPAP